MEKLKFKLGVSSDLRNEVLLMQESQLRFIIRLCDPLHEKKGSAIHEIRRSFKKCRSLLRLIRDSMGYAMYYRENTQMRDMHRLLSHARDADVFYSMWKALPATFNGLEAQSWYRTTLDAASAQRQAERDQLISAEVPERIRRGTRQ